MFVGPRRIVRPAARVHGPDCLPGGEPVAATPASAEVSPQVPVGLETYYSQEADWYPCSDGMDKTQEDTGYTCATVSVPWTMTTRRGDH
ncbi:hypothetical protein [Actinomyces lilanjuaniae]|uniref:hypothetical protein n=1 Tax=Actinomyces lilanjuaniae TaxID=2321394 RepID=UPI001FAA3F34|nr:hypothetical protein [Actinomyces lilanjuaniae]